MRGIGAGYPSQNFFIFRRYSCWSLVHFESNFNGAASKGAESTPGAENAVAKGSQSSREGPILVNYCTLKTLDQH